MKWLKRMQVAWRSIYRNKMRSFLTSLGIIIGVCSVIVMVAIGEGSTRQIESNISSMGVNLIMVRNPSMRHRGVSLGGASEETLTFEDVDYLRQHSKECKYFSARVRANGQIIGGVGNWNCSIEGIDPDYLNIRNYEIASGAVFTDRDVSSKRKVCLVGQTVVDELFPGMNPIGERIRIRNIPFKIVGVLAEKGENSFGQDQDDVIFTPSTTALYRLTGGQNIAEIYLSANEEDNVDAAIEEVTELMRDAHKLARNEEDDFRIRSQSEMTEMFTSVSSTMTMLLGSIAGVSLMVGGIGIMNIMLVSVTERTREIGIRLSVGARTRDVLMQFLTEAVVLSLLGGGVGIGMAFAIIWLCNHVFNLPAYASPHIVALAVSFAAAVGVFFGWYPARKASRLHPIDALRYE